MPLKYDDLNMNEKKLLNKNILAIAVCWLVYTCSYLGKLGYNANIILIEREFGVAHAESGSVGTAFFFAYGAGQIINGLLCKKYNVKYTIFFALIVSAVCNFTLTVITDFAWLKIVWLVNGAALSFLWSLLIRFLSETLDSKYTSKAVVIMGTTVAAGTFAVYGLSALFAAISVYKAIFYLAAVLLPTIAIIWFLSFKSISQTQNKEPSENTPIVDGETAKKKADFGFVTLINVMAIFAIVTNVEKDGITVWIPTILKELYDMPDYLSILLTLFLPLIAVFGTAVAVYFNKYIKNFISLCGLFFLVTTLALVVNVLFLKSSAAVMLICLSIISLLMSGTNNIITGMLPLYYKDKANAGLLAGVLNGCCYVGSTLSSYVLGLIADNYGWEVVFYILIACAAICSIIAIIAHFIKGNNGKTVRVRS